VNSPSNPTAAVASAAVLADLVELVRRYDAYILSDEAYESIVFSGGRAASPLTVGADRTFSARTFSKTYSMTGLRVGSLVSPSSFRVPVAAVHGSTVGAAPTTAQDVALAALRSMPGRSDEVAAVYRERFELAAEVLGPWNPNPDIRSLGGFYLWVGSLTSGRLSASQGRPVHGGREIAGELRHEGILVSMGEVYSPTATGFIRIALTAPAHVLRPAIEVVRETLES
jgi:aspartate/methionine/tyrosine aminotransferase